MSVSRMERRPESVCPGRSRKEGEVTGREREKRLQRPPGKRLTDIKAPGEQEFVGVWSVWVQDSFQKLSAHSLSGGWCPGVHVGENTVQVGPWGSDIQKPLARLFNEVR